MKTRIYAAPAVKELYPNNSGLIGWYNELKRLLPWLAGKGLPSLDIYSVLNFDAAVWYVEYMYQHIYWIDPVSRS